ncbi:hypothetical protein GW17_00048387, partial [Ensete ventricosum]
AMKLLYWDAEVESLDMEELQEFERQLVELRNNVARRADQLLQEANAAIVLGLSVGFSIEFQKKREK